MKRYFLKVLLGFMIIMSGSVYSQQFVDGIIAIVGNEIIMASEMQTLLLQYAMQSNNRDILTDPVKRGRLEQEYMQRMIDEKVLLIRAKEDTIVPDADRVDQLLDQQINGFLQQAGSEERLVKYYGMPLAKIKKELRKRIENHLTIEQLRQRQSYRVKISRREVENFYQNYQDSLPKIDASVDISHILLQVKPSGEAAETAFAKASKAKAELDGGADFVEMVRKYSEGPSSTNDGDLGWVGRGDFVKEFEEAAYALDDGEISDIVQSQFGFHIIQMLEKQGERIHTRHILIKLEPTPEDESRTAARIGEIRQRIVDGGADFAEMAVANSDDPNVQTDRGNLGKFTMGSFQVKAFEEAVKGMKVGEISQPVKTEFGYHIIRLNATEASRPISLAGDWQQIEQIALDYKRSLEFERWLEELRNEIPIELKDNI